MTNVTVLNDDDPKVRLMYAQRKALASVLEVFAEALRAHVPLREEDFDDVAGEIARYRESLARAGSQAFPALPLRSAESTRHWRRPLRIESTKMEKPMHAKQNELPWGPRLDSIRVYFNNVFKFLPSNQSRKFCTACGSQATFVKLDEDGEPLAFYCDDHVFEARR